MTRRLECSACKHRFVPLEDAGVSCPECGEITMMMLRDAGSGVTCLACGYVFREQSPLRRLYFLVPVVGGFGVGLIVIILILLGLLSTGGGRPGCYFFDTRRPANEASAISVLRTLSSAQELYCTRYGYYATLPQLANANMIDTVLANATTPQRAKYGYYFQLTLVFKAAGVSVTQTGWQCTALPAEPGVTGTRSFFIDETGVIYFAPCESSSDPPASPGTGTPLGQNY
jgi:predicted RNA-binding Zn-ribbon protein involved in translation (DUF1610 family)